MTAPLFLVDAERLRAARPGSALLLDGPEGRHAASARRLRPGERVDVGDGRGTVARCAVTAAGRGEVELTVEAVDLMPGTEPRLVLVQALAKGGRDELAVEAATEAGVDAVVPWQAGRSVVRWEGERGQRSRRRWESTVREAAKQSRRPYVPVVEGVVTTRELAERIAAAPAAPGAAPGRALLLDAAAERSLSEVELPREGSLLVVVGPEGGLDEAEAAVLGAAGAVAVRLGPQILRTSTAGPLALAVISARTGRWSVSRP